ncbi:hypothetical protein K443DRAFT_465934 [Laccaria amethystina LaAM-08-1]|uniref:Uncharacterized protein n=1 Tax=Laccaria amethystina LaAM-08-1 TaxID=1095629 RepID=A0A0C9Y138_9AGAR|nr:hypothetical protein K443DRAFT_465934 [Laccaria amethystina LaAM-08-1]
MTPRGVSNAGGDRHPHGPKKPWPFNSNLHCQRDVGRWVPSDLWESNYRTCLRTPNSCRQIAIFVTREVLRNAHERDTWEPGGLVLISDRLGTNYENLAPALSERVFMADLVLAAHIILVRISDRDMFSLTRAVTSRSLPTPSVFHPSIDDANNRSGIRLSLEARISCATKFPR